MKPLRLLAAAATALAVVPGLSQAQSHTVTFSVGSVSTITLGANPAALNVTPALAGQPTSTVSQGSTYSITTNTVKKITALISVGGAMPTGLTLSVNLQAPSTGTSAGTVPLGVAAVDVVTSIDPVSAAGLTMTYTLAATAQAAPTTTPQTRTVTYTVLDP